jgi:hypothetical protein
MVHYGVLIYLAEEIAHNANVRAGRTGVRINIHVQATELEDGRPGKKKPGIHKDG